MSTKQSQREAETVRQRETREIESETEREKESEPLWVSDLRCGGPQVEVPRGGVQSAVGAQVGRGSGGEDPHRVLSAPC